MKKLGLRDFVAPITTCMPCSGRPGAALGAAVFALCTVLVGCHKEDDGVAPQPDASPGTDALSTESPAADTAPAPVDANSAPADTNPTSVDANPAIDVGTAASPLQRELAPEVPAADLTTLSSDNAAFAFDLYAKLKAGNGDVAFSPVSISLALAMTYAGAANGTAAEMAKTLHFTLPSDQLHRAFNGLDQTLVSRGVGRPALDGSLMQLTIANSLWLDQSFLLRSSFLDTLAVNYGAGVNLVDFINTPDAARRGINAWVADQTAGKIAELLAPESISNSVRLVLANAIYFNAAWQSPFNATFNHSSSFTLLDGTVTSKSYMYQSLSIPAGPGTGFVAAALPYQDERLSMVIVLPDAGRFAEVESSLDGAGLASLVTGLTYQKVSLYLPPFHVDTHASLKDLLASLGMPSAFGPFADFSAMANDPLYISDVIHEAFVTVAEKGTEAGAATAVIMGDASISMDAGPPPLLVKADRPFLYFIYDKPTGAILFMGRVLDPAQP
jgi:serpin B